MKAITISRRIILEQTGYTIYANEAALERAPVGELQDIEWFTLGKYVTRKELEKEYEKRGLEPVNLNTLAAHCTEQDYAATIWEDDGPCCAAFSRWNDERRVRVNRFDGHWRAYWWFAGRRKSSELGTKPSSDTQSLELPDELVVNGKRYHAV